MSTLLKLAPEIRNIIYQYLLEDCVDTGKRIYYCNIPSTTTAAAATYRWLRVDKTCSTTLTCHAEDHRVGPCLFEQTHGAPQPLVHYVNLNSLSALGRSCRGIHNETRPFMWSNADLTIQNFAYRSHEAMTFVAQSLTPVIAANITTLSIQIMRCEFPGLKKSLKLVVKHLPQLQLVSVYHPLGPMNGCGYVPTRVNSLILRIIRAGINFQRLGCLTLLDESIRIAVKAHIPLAVLSDLSSHDRGRLDPYLEKLNTKYELSLSTYQLRKQLRRDSQSMHFISCDSGAYLEDTLDLRSLAID